MYSGCWIKWSTSPSSLSFKVFPFFLWGRRIVSLNLASLELHLRGFWSPCTPNDRLFPISVAVSSAHSTALEDKSLSSGKIVCSLRLSRSKWARLSSSVAISVFNSKKIGDPIFNGSSCAKFDKIGGAERLFHASRFLSALRVIFRLLSNGRPPFGVPLENESTASNSRHECGEAVISWSYAGPVSIDTDPEEPGLNSTVSDLSKHPRFSWYSSTCIQGGIAANVRDFSMSESVHGCNELSIESDLQMLLFG